MHFGKQTRASIQQPATASAAAASLFAFGQLLERGATDNRNPYHRVIGRVGEVPATSLGWFRAGVGFYNKREFQFSIECLQKSVQMDPLNYNAFQIMARACIAVNRRDDAIEALKQSVKLDNPSDWQLLVELTAQEKAAKKAQEAMQAAANSSSNAAAAAAPDSQPAVAASSDSGKKKSAN